MASMNLLSTRLLALVKYGQWDQKDVVDLFVALTKQYENMTESDFITRTSKTLYQIEIHKIKKSDLTDKPEARPFVKDIEGKVHSIAKNTREKTLEEIIEEIRAQGNVGENILGPVKDIVSSVSSWFRSEPPAIPNPIATQWKDKETLFKLCKAVHKTKKWFPRLTQMVSWCILVLSGSSRLVQVGTGEGKSCIVAMFAAYCTMIDTIVKTGASVDVISSSPVLAERDAEEWHPFYKELNISVDVNTNKEPDKDLRKCYECKVVYGTTQSFAGDWLRQRFHREDVRPGRQFQCVIVDEVDSLMLDKGLEVVYLNGPMPVMQAFNVILAEIWCAVNQLEHVDTGKTLGLLQPFSQLLSEILGTDTDLDELSILQMAEDSGLTPTGSTRRIRENTHSIIQQLEGVSIDQMAAFFNMFEKAFPQYKFKLYRQEEERLQELNDNSSTDARNRQEVHILIVGSGFCRSVFMDEETLHTSLEKKIRAGILSGVQAAQDSGVPSLLEYVNDKLQTWIENAFLAKTMTKGHEYILHGDTVAPVDYRSTGVVQNNMKWGDGLQQFLEMKHQTRLTDMSVITNFKSNVSLFKSYKQHIYGVTGTLGNQTELDMLQDLYSGIKTSKIPSFKQRKLYEEDGMVMSEEEEWVERICSVVKTQVNPTVYRGPRAALVICETIKRAETIYRALTQTIRGEKLKLYTNNNMDNSKVTDTEVMAGDVIIATNLAGRGTDLKVCKEVKEAGGLFVLQTFLPLNVRVENQAFGRTARQGSPGSARLIMCSTHFSESLKLVMVIQTSPLFLLLSSLDRVTSSLISESFDNEFREAFSTYKENPNSQNYEVMARALRNLLVVQKPIGPTILEKAKEARDTIVQMRLSGFLEKDIPKITKKEELFSDYLDMLDTIYKQDLCPSSREDMVSSLHECWGMWLLIKFKEDESTETLRQQLREYLDSAKLKLQSEQSPSTMVYHYIRSGNRLRREGKLAESIEMYTRAIQKDACWVAIALYNRAGSTLKKRGSGYIAQALEDLEKAEKEVESYMKQLELIFKYVKISSKGPNEDDNFFNKQFRAKYLVQHLLRINIQEAVKVLQTATSRGRDVQVTEKHVLFLMMGCLLLLPASMMELTRELANLNSVGLDTIFSLDTSFSFAGLLTKVFRSAR